MNNTLCTSLARQLEEVYYQLPWIWESYDKKFKSINEDNVFIQPASGYNSVAQIISHLNEWRKELLSRMTGSTEINLRATSPHNFIDNETLKARGWDALKKESDDTQQQLIQLLRSQTDDFLERTFQYEEKQNTYLYYVEGLLHHDIYHLGQIGLVLKMISKESV